VPEKVTGVPAIKIIGGGVHFSMFVDEEGNVWVCGWNSKGELGLGNTTQINKPVQNNNLSRIVALGGGTFYFSLFLDREGNIFTCGRQFQRATGIGGHEYQKHTTESQQHASSSL
jgi:alpha-tubulin suppressor-like RCC1 family protein